MNVLPTILFIITSLFVAICVVLLFLYLDLKKKYQSSKSDFELQRVELNKKLKESQFFLSLTDSLDHSVDLKKIMDSVSRSISDVLPYSTLSYILLDGNKVFFKSFLQENVSRNYLDDVKKAQYFQLRILLAYMVCSLESRCWLLLQIKPLFATSLITYLVYIH
jgi:hypothetical protein